jgi:hypothetical protein
VALRRSDIVGKRILQVLQTPWVENPPGSDYSSSHGFVQLESGAIFPISILSILDKDQAEIEEAHLSPGEAEPLDFRNTASCVGEVIEEVLLCEDWCPYALGLFLSSKRVLCQIDSPGCSGPGLVAGDVFVTHRPVVFWDRLPFLMK